MHFPDGGGVVSLLFQHFGEGDGCLIGERRSQLGEGDGMRQASGDEGLPRGGAHRAVDERVGEFHAGFREPADIGGFGFGIAVGSGDVCGMVVGNDEEHVWLFFFGESRYAAGD